MKEEIVDQYIDWFCYWQVTKTRTYGMEDFQIKFGVTGSDEPPVESNFPSEAKAKSWCRERQAKLLRQKLKTGS